jgi:sulfopyruvate decarboxylase TPP-binding subunit
MASDWSPSPSASCSFNETEYHRQVVQAEPVARPVSAEAILNELYELRISHVINVPDTHQRTLLKALSQQSRIKVLTACTEDEAIAINAGLWIGGQRPILSIQQVGLLAALNNVKGISMDGRIPTCMLVGYFGRDVSLPARTNPGRGVHLIEPTLDAWGVAYFPIESPADLPAIRNAYQHSLDHSGPSVVLIGAPTA